MRGRHVAREDFLLDYVRPNPMERGKKREKEGKKKKRSKKLHILSRISGDRAVGFCWSKR